MAPSDWEADEMLDVYIHDYMVKKKLYSTADSFMTDGKVSHAHAAIEAPGGALFQMWSAFLDMYSDKTKKKQSDVEFGLNGYIHDYLVKKNLHYVALSFMTELKVSPDPVEINAPGGFLSKWWSVFWAFFIARSRSITNEKHAAEEASPRQLPLDPSTVYGQGVLQSKPGMGSAGLNPGGWALPLQGWPLTGIDNMPQGFDPQVQNAFLQNQGQFQLPPQQQQQQTMARDQGQGNMTNSSLYGQQNANDGSISYPMPSNSSNLINIPQPLTPSTLTPIEGVAITGNMQHGNNMPKGPMMYGSDAIGGLPSSANQMTRGDIEAFEDVGNLEDNAESFSVGGLASSANQLAVMEAFEDVDMESVFKAIDWNPSEEQQIQMNQPNMDPRMALLKPGTTNHGEMVQGSPQGGVSAALQQPQSHKPICNCKKTKCLQLYCDCFAAGVFCIGPACSCVDCCNKPAHEDTVMESRKKIESRDPLAFAPRIISRSSDSVEQTREDDGSKTSDSKRHIRGCNCKKSNCQKNYCECFKGGVACTANCRCKSCKNTFDPMVKA